MKLRNGVRLGFTALKLILPLAGLTTLAGCSWFKAPGSIFKPKPRVVTLESLIKEEPDLNAITRFPDPPFTCQQSSSYDRKSKTAGNEDWFANADVGQYIRVEEHGDRKEYVMHDSDGPGAVVRIWSANPQGTLRFYLNGAADPVFAVGMEELLGGRNPMFPTPIVGLRAAGWNLFFPIGYSKHLKITSDNGKFYYHVNYRTYPEGTQVEDFNPEAVRAMGPAITEMMSRMEGADRPAKISGANQPAFTLAPGERKLLFEEKNRKGRAIVALNAKVTAKDLTRALRGVTITLEFDGPSGAVSEVPIGDFFGSTPGINPYQTLPLGMLDDGTMYSRWIMPFKKSARVYATNTNGGDDVAVNLWATTANYAGGFDSRTMYFHAGWVPGFEMATRPMRDFNFVDLKGKGVFVGDSLGVANPARQWWGEGDEKIYYDGQTFPSTFGTGTEDYYGYAWCSTAKFMHPFHSQSRCDGPNNYGYTSVNRFQIFDRIPFTKNFRFDIEVWHWAEAVKVSYAATSYWYARPGTLSNFSALKAEELIVPVIEPLPVYKVANAIEAESMTLGATAGKADQQDMAGFGAKWSGNTHVWWHEAKLGDSLSFKIDAPADGRYEVFAALTRADDYGIVQAEVNGHLAAEKLDCYAPKIKAPEEISLGVHELAKYNNIVRFTIVGSNEKAKPSFMMGVDYLRLKPVAK